MRSGSWREAKRRIRNGIRASAFRLDHADATCGDPATIAGQVVGITWGKEPLRNNWYKCS